MTTLTDEVGQGVYCRRMRVSALQCRNAWLGLCDFVFAQLKSQRGVSLPGLGSFAVGPCVDTYNGGVLEQRAPVFVMAQKFEGIPQARGRFFLTKPATYARIPTAALAERCGVHKAGASHVLKEIIALIAEKLLAGDPVDVPRHKNTPSSRRRARLPAGRPLFVPPCAQHQPIFSNLTRVRMNAPSLKQGRVGTASPCVAFWRQSTQ